MGLDFYLAEHWDRTEEDETAFRHYLANNYNEGDILTEDDWNDHLTAFDECYIGCMPFKDYVEEAFFDAYDVPEHLSNYIDIDAVARDWELSGDYWTVEDGNGCEYIFRNY